MSDQKKHFHVFDKNKKDDEIEHYDVCIIGGGPAGLTAAIYSTRYGLHTALISKDIGGMANLAEKIENYPGFEGSGFELMQKFQKQAEKFGTEFLLSEVSNLYKDKTGFIIELKDSRVVHTKTIIISSGTEKRKLDIPGEKEFVGRGVSYCAACDGNFFKNKDVAVIGGANSAAKAALHLARLAKKVYILYRKEKLRCDDIDASRINETKNIEVIYNAIPKEIKGKDVVEELAYEQDKKEKRVKVSGVFVEVGSIPASAIVKKLKINVDKEGYIEVDEDMKTNVEGVFAAGDAVKRKLKQVIIAASQGAIAAKSASDFLNRR